MKNILATDSKKQNKFPKQRVTMPTANDAKVDLAPIVKLYQETNDPRFFEVIMNAYRGRIQGRVYNTSVKYGLYEHDCESTLNESLWNATQTYNPEFGVPFDKYVSMKFSQDLTTFFNYDCRHNKLFSPRTKGEDFFDKDTTTNFQMVYTLSDENWEVAETGDLQDPRVDIENFIVDEDSAEMLVKEIADEIGESYANVAVLSACGYSQRDIAKAMNYNPEGVVSSEAMNMWIKRRLKKCRIPATNYYEKMDMKIPINITA